MEVYFNNETQRIADLYEGEEDIPGLAISVHLHNWSFKDQSGAGDARFRVEIREGDTTPARPMVAVGFVDASSEGVSHWEGQAPLATAILDGLMSHQSVRAFFAQAAEQALQIEELVRS